MNKAGSAKFCLPLTHSLTHSLTHTNPYLPSYSIKTPKLEAEKEREKKIKITQSPLLSQKPKHLQIFFFQMEISSRTCFPFLSTETVPLLKPPFHTSSPSLRILAARPVNLRMGRTVVTCATASTGNRAPSGIMKPKRVSPEMADFVGAPEVSRTQVLKLIWAHIKERNLQVYFD